MKKTVFYFVLIIGIAVSMTSCISFLASLKVHKMVVDENVPADQTVIITFENNSNNGWFYVREWNNELSSKHLGEALYGKGGGNVYAEGNYSKEGVWNNQKTRLTVPAGNNSFTFDVNYRLYSYGGQSAIDYPFKAIELKYNLEQGKEYRIECIYKPNEPSKGRFGLYIGIYEVTGKKGLLLREWKLGETR